MKKLRSAGIAFNHADGLTLASATREGASAASGGRHLSGTLARSIDTAKSARTPRRASARNAESAEKITAASAAAASFVIETSRDGPAPQTKAGRPRSAPAHAGGSRR